MNIVLYEYVCIESQFVVVLYICVYELKILLDGLLHSVQQILGT